MRPATDRRLAAVEATLGAAADARRRERESRAFWQRMKELSERTGLDLVARPSRAGTTRRPLRRGGRRPGTAWTRCSGRPAR